MSPVCACGVRSRPTRGRGAAPSVAVAILNTAKNIPTRIFSSLFDFIFRFRFCHRRRRCVSSSTPRFLRRCHSTRSAKIDSTDAPRSTDTDDEHNGAAPNETHAFPGIAAHNKSPQPNREKKNQSADTVRRIVDSSSVHLKKNLLCFSHSSFLFDSTFCRQINPFPIMIRKLSVA